MAIRPHPFQTTSLHFARVLLTLVFLLTPNMANGADETALAGEDTRQINGTVVDEQGKPIAGATVWHNYGFHPMYRMEVTATTDTAGKFTLQVPTKLKDNEVARPSGIWAYSPKYSLGSSRWAKSPTKPTDNQVVLLPDTDTSFVVLDPDGNPVDGAIVEPINYRNHLGYALVPVGAKPMLECRTDKEGRVRMPAMARDRLFVVQVATEEYGLQTQQCEVHPDAPAEQTINLRPVCRIEGMLTAENPQWVQGIRIGITTEHQGAPRPPFPTAGQAYVFTDFAGKFVVPKIAAGRLLMLEPVISEDLPVRPKLPDRIKLPVGETTIFQIPMVDLVDIHGSIVAEDTDEPLPDIKVRVYYGSQRQGTHVVTDENGEFTARVMPGKVRFQLMNLSRTKYVQLGSPKSFDVPEDAEDFEAPPIKPVLTEPIGGTLIDQDGKPVAEARVIGYYKNWLFSFGKTDSDGKFTLPKKPISINADDATYRVELGVGETRFMRDDGVKLINADPLEIRVER